MSGRAPVEVELDRDVFLRTLIRHLTGALEDVVGVKEAEGFVAVVGQKIGEELNDAYRREFGVPSLDRPTVARVLVDLKRRIQGDFYVIEESDEKIVLGNRACPFGDKVVGRESMCMMTSNVFGAIAAENLGFARVELQETIARGDPGCRVVVHLKPSDATDSSAGRIYTRSGPGDA